MNSPGSFVHWSISDISLANLVLIAVMVLIFGLALLLPFRGNTAWRPARRRTEPRTPRRARRASRVSLHLHILLRKDIDA